jgi:hypothetical protein
VGGTISGAWGNIDRMERLYAVMVAFGVIGFVAPAMPG